MSEYGAVFDGLVYRWTVIEDAHDEQHPDRNDCGGVGGCSMMFAAVRLIQEMAAALTHWRRDCAAGENRAVKVALRPTDDAARSGQVYGRDALLTVLTCLDQWCEEVEANNDARQVEAPAGTEFEMYPSDVRTIVEAAARELGVKL